MSGYNVIRLDASTFRTHSIALVGDPRWTGLGEFLVAESVIWSEDLDGPEHLGKCDPDESKWDADPAASAEFVNASFAEQIAHEMQTVADERAKRQGVEPDVFVVQACAEYIESEEDARARFACRGD